MLGHMRYSGWTNIGATTARYDISPQGDDEESLLGAIEVVDEEVAIDVPLRQVLGAHDGVVAGRCAEIDDKAVFPGRGVGVDARGAAEEVADAGPGLRGEGRDGEFVEEGHVCAFRVPGCGGLVGLAFGIMFCKNTHVYITHPDCKEKSRVRITNSPC